MMQVGQSSNTLLSDGTPHMATVVEFDVDTWLGRDCEIVWVSYDDEPWQCEWYDIKEFKRMLRSG